MVAAGFELVTSRYCPEQATTGHPPRPKSKKFNFSMFERWHPGGAKAQGDVNFLAAFTTPFFSEKLFLHSK